MKKYSCKIKGCNYGHSFMAYGLNAGSYSDFLFDADTKEEMLLQISNLGYFVNESVIESIEYGINVLDNKDWFKNDPKSRCWTTMLKNNSGNPIFHFWFPEDALKADKLKEAYSIASTREEYNIMEQKILYS